MNVRCNRVILYTLETVPSQSIVVSRVIVIKRVRYNEVRLYFFFGGGAPEKQSHANIIHSIMDKYLKLKYNIL